MSDERGNRKKVKGTVVSNKMDDTIVVEITRRIRHPVYQKVVNRKKKVYAHSAGSSLQIGDQVEIVETRPMSKLKRWRVV